MTYLNKCRFLKKKCLILKVFEIIFVTNQNEKLLHFYKNIKDKYKQKGVVDMKKKTWYFSILVIMSVLLTGCQLQEVNVSTSEGISAEAADIEISENAESFQEEIMSAPDAGTGDNMSSEKEIASEPESEMTAEQEPERALTVYISEEDIIDEKTALDIAYAFWYEDSEMEQYSVFCEELPYFNPENFGGVQTMIGETYDDTPKMGYVVVQYTAAITEMEKYDAANPALDQNKIILMPLGISENGAFYRFWLCQYIWDGGENYHFTTMNHIAVSLDGKTIVAERSDIGGNDISNPESWETYYDYLECDSEFLNAEERETKIVELLDALTEPLFDREVAEELYMLRNNQENAAEFEGTWNRTNVVRGEGAEIEITNQDETGFLFDGMFMYYSHSGGVSAMAEFITENVAIHRMYDWEMKKSEEYLLFCRTEEGMKIYATTGDSGKLGFGAGCRADGEYVQGEPVYTNGTAMNDNFTVEEQTAICNLLGPDIYENVFEFCVEYGYLGAYECVLEDGAKAVYYEAFMPTMGGYAFELLKCENGDLYCLIEHGPGWFTTVEEALEFPAFEYTEHTEE